MKNVSLPNPLRELHLFAGAGGGILGGLLCGHTCVCAVEIEPYPRKVLLQRQRDGILPKFPIWDDVKTFSGRPWRGKVDVVCGGFPCTNISSARSNNHQNGKIEGISGQHSGLWREQRRIIAEVQPAFVLIENSPALRTRGLSLVLRELAAMGYDARWGVLGVRQFGADHIRDRIWIVASNADLPQREGGGLSSRVHQEDTDSGRTDWWKNQPGMERVAYGMAGRVDRLKAIGNGQVPAVARLAWNALKPSVLD